MQSLPQRHLIALAVAACVGMTSLAHADTTPFDRQERGGLMLNIPFDSRGLVFKDTVLSLVFQSAKVKSSAYGWQLAFGSKLNSFSPVFAISAIGGDRCGQATVGVSYGEGKWGVPIGIQGPYVQVGLSNVGSFGGFQAGLNTMGCFKRYAPPAAAGTGGSSGPSGSGSQSQSSGSSASSGSQQQSSGSFSTNSVSFNSNVDDWLRGTPDAGNQFDWA